MSGPDLAARAKELLAKRRLTTLVREAHRLGAELARVERELGTVRDQISLLDRIWLGESRDEARERELGAERERLVAAAAQAQAHAASALAQVEAELPPLAIARRVEQVIAAARRLLANNDYGQRAIMVDLRGVVTSELEALGETIRSTWFPDFDLVDGLNALRDQRPTRASTQARVAPFRRSATLGFAPVTVTELRSRAARQLDSDTFRQAAARSIKENVDVERANVVLSRARAHVRKLEDPGLRSAQDRLAAEWREAVDAAEQVEAHVFGALAAFPPMGLYLAVQSTLGACLALDHRAPIERALQVDGGLRGVPSFGLRALAMAGLVRMRRAVDTSFPGLAALIAPRPARVSEAPWLAHIMSRFAQIGVQQALDRALLHAPLIAAHRVRERALARVARNDRSVEPALAASRAQHRFSSLALERALNELYGQAWAVSRELPGLRVRDAIVNAAVATGAVSAVYNRTASVCVLVRREGALAAAALLAQEIQVSAPQGRVSRELVAGVARFDAALRATHAKAVGRLARYPREPGCIVLGLESGFSSLQGLAVAAFRVWGDMPPDGLLLYHFAERELAR